MSITKTLSHWMCIVVVLLLLFSPLHAQQYGWKVIARPTNRNLEAVEFIDELHGWCTGDDGNIYRTTDGGLTWQGSTRPSNPNVLFDLTFSDLLHGWAIGTFAGGDGLIWRTIDGGASWSQQVSKGNRRYRSTSTQSLNQNTTVGSKYFRSDTGVTVQTIDGGIKWTERTIADSLERFAKVEFVDPLHGWITTGFTLNGKFAILSTTNGGNTWQIFPTKLSFGAISFIDTLRGWAVNTNPATYAHRTTDGGKTWKQLGRIYDPIWDDLNPHALSFVDSLNGWVFGLMFYQGDLTGVIFRTVDGGVSWQLEHVGQTRRLLDGLMLDKHQGWAVGGNGVVLGYQLLTTVSAKLPMQPKSFALHQNYPNPFNAMTNIEYEVTNRTAVSIKIYDSVGREVQQLIDSVHEPGVYRLRFDGSGLASGAYYYTMKASDFSETKEMILSK